ncbi:MAG: glycosyltransferase [Gammaproteobacteria bacterium]|nr:glycosyltransferase [Gammaproteobacteria bacterium]
MNIVMLTNTFTPHIGGVARSVEAFTNEYRRRSHRVLVVAPEFPDMPQHEIDVVRIPAIQNFNGSDFSVVLPVSGLLTEVLDEFSPEIIHAHHPYLLGVTALRVARYRNLPLVFTHHTLYEEYTHYVPGDAPKLRRFIIEAAIRYANLSDRVFAPSESIMKLLRERGVETPVTVVPTGVQAEHFAHGNGERFRVATGIPEDAFVVGHLGRLAPEKNLKFLAEAAAAFLKTTSRAHFLVIGTGPSGRTIRDIFTREGLETRLHIASVLEHGQLADALQAMNLFAFASKSETQGMVLTEAMAAGLPVVALDANGVREVVSDYKNGRLLHGESIEAFVSALQWVAGLSEKQVRELARAAHETAEVFSMSHSADKALACYTNLRDNISVERPEQEEHWHHLLDLIKVEWEILKGIGSATDAALGTDEETG